MVSLFQAHAASAIVIGSALCLTTCAGSRASVSFRPPIPASYFDSNPSFALDPAKISPTAIAQAFLASSAFLNGSTLLRDPFPPSFFIHPDSYTDDTTGITHVYARQQAHYWEISNAHINLNIRNGVVLSHGSSLFSGDISSNIVPVPSWTLDDYCASSFTASSNFTCGHFRNRLCALSATINLTVSEFNPIPAAYLFTLAAYPGPIPSNTSIEQVYNGLYDCGTLHNWNGRECWAAYNLPFVLSPVKGYKMYIQTPAKGSNLMKLSPVWCLEVELAENQYEVYVSLNDPSKVVMVADWAADGPSWKWSDLAGSSKSKLLERNTRHNPAPTSVTSSSVPRGTYRVWRWDAGHPTRDERSLEVAPHEDASSPQGWHKAPEADYPMGLGPGGPHGFPWSPTTYFTPLPTSIYPSGVSVVYPRPTPTAVLNFTNTTGNNVIAQASAGGRKLTSHVIHPDGGPELVFDFPYHKSDDKKDQSEWCANATVTQLFYLANMFHDLMFLYGFDENSGNFQQYNFERSEGERGAVILDVQDGHEFDYTIFKTPPDGRSGRCQLNIWNFCDPFGDEELETRALLGSLSHGLAARLTGGPRDSSCLANGEAGGLGLGWASFISKTIRDGIAHIDYSLNVWPEHPDYQISLHGRILPQGSLMYDYLLRRDYRELHAMGEIWAEILWVVLYKFVAKHGFVKSLFPTNNPNFYAPQTPDHGANRRVPKYGNSLMLLLVIHGMKLQPCHPTFLQARDAIIAADRDLTGGENKCLLWVGFASRGMGVDAKKLDYESKSSINGFSVPPECQQAALERVTRGLRF